MRVLVCVCVCVLVLLGGCVCVLHPAFFFLLSALVPFFSTLYPPAPHTTLFFFFHLSSSPLPAVASYKPQTAHCLELEFGQHVQLLEECGSWYRGRFLTRGSKLGIFPKSHVSLKKCRVSGPPGQFETVEFEEDQLAREIADVVHEWGRLLLIQFVDPEQSELRFRDLRAKLEKLIQYRRDILAGTLPHDKLSELKSKIVYQVDSGNRELRLDYIPRNEHGLTMSVKTSTVMELYQVHQQAVTMVRKQSATRMQKFVTTAEKEDEEKIAIQIFFKHDIGDKFDIGEEQEIYYSLYDARQETFVNEPFVVKLDKSGSLPEPSHPNSPNVTTCLFTDVNCGGIDNLHLVATVIRLGAMEEGRVQKYETSGKLIGQSPTWLRRPVACGAISIGVQSTQADVQGRSRMPLYQCQDDVFSQVHQRIIKKDPRFDYHKTGKEIVFSCKVLQGNATQVKKENPMLFHRNTGEAPRRDFPDLMKPDDNRNDLYVSLSRGSFDKSSGKTTPRNIEVSVQVLLDNGDVLPDCIVRGSGLQPCSEYFSVIYYHSNTPEWNETIKLVIPPAHYSKAHLRFNFRHCSSKDAPGKKKAEIFCFAFKPLVEPGSGRGLKDGSQSLSIYKYDKSLYAVEPSLGIIQYRTMNAPLQLNPKDTFIVETKSCSTSQLQNPRLIQFFKWHDNPEFVLADTLPALGNSKDIPGIEIVKKLGKIFDELFMILAKFNKDQKRKEQVVAALMRISGLLSEPRFKNFKPVLNKYIESSAFKDPEVHVLLVNYVKASIRPEIWDQASPDLHQKALETMKALEPVFKFIVRSREVQTQGKAESGVEDTKFKEEITGMIAAFSRMMVDVKSPAAIQTQEKCLRHFAAVFDDLAKFFLPADLSGLVTGFIQAVKRQSRSSRTEKATLHFIGCLVESSLFKDAAPRRHLLPEILQVLSAFLKEEMSNENAHEALRIVANIVGNLEKEGNFHDMDIVDVSAHLLKQLLEIVCNGREEVLVLSCLITVLRMMSAQHWDKHLAKLKREEQVDFMNTALNAFLKLCPKPGERQDRFFESEWRVMIMLKNDTILQAVQSISVPLRKLFLKPAEFVDAIWLKFFKLASNYMCQKSLQLEQFSVAKREAIFGQHGDKRVDMAKLIRELWCGLDRKQRLQLHIPEKPKKKKESVLGWFQEAALVPEAEARTEVIHIFFDMMECEASERGNFDATERDMTDNLDKCIQKGLGDDQYKELFEKLVSKKCNGSSHKIMRSNGPDMITSVTSLLDSLLALRYVPDGKTFDDWRAGCMYNLVRYYKRNDRVDISIRTLHKLTDILVKSEQFTEAGFALKIHAEALNWGDKELEAMTDGDGEVPVNRFPKQTESARKEELYKRIINHFASGDTWENAVPVAQELAKHYMEETFEYTKLSKLHGHMSDLYRKIAEEKRREPQYFKVGYYGQKMPPEFKNKQYIYRGWKTDHIAMFCERIRNQFPNAELMMHDKDPTEKMINDTKDTYIMICKVEPVPDAEKLKIRFKGKQDKIPPELRAFADYNEVSAFKYKRQFRKGDKTANEFETLWVIDFTLVTEEAMPAVLGRGLVKKCSRKEISPIENAIIAMNDKNEDLMRLILEKQQNPHMSLNPLSLILSGVIDAAVMGGTDKYREAFFSPKYLEENPENQHLVVDLQKLISKTVTICEGGLMVHKMHCPASLQEKQKLLESQLETMKAKAAKDAATPIVSPKGSPRRAASASTLVGAGLGSATAPKESGLLRSQSVASRPKAKGVLNPFSGGADDDDDDNDDDDGTAAVPPPILRAKKPTLADLNLNPFAAADAGGGAGGAGDAGSAGGAGGGGTPPQLPPRAGRRLSITKIIPASDSNPFPMMVQSPAPAPAPAKHKAPVAAPAKIRGPTASNPFSTVTEAAPFPAQKPTVRKANPFKKKATSTVAATPKPAAGPNGPAPTAGVGARPQNFDSDDSSDDDTDSDEDENANPFLKPAAPVPPRPTSSKPPPVARKPTQGPK